MRGWQQVLVEYLVDLELLDASYALQAREALGRYLRGSCDELQEVGLHLAVEVVQNLPEPLYLQRVFSVVVVLSMLAQVVD